MTRSVISVEHLTKQYDLGLISSGTLARDLSRWWARVRGKEDPFTRVDNTNPFLNNPGESILALNDVSFKVEEGQALGIVGRNGAGKSTLLKILSRVTAPTSGVVKVKGRIGSLLEVGTGFHPELTGRENVFLNGAILGMNKAEVQRKFDEIVDFSGVEKFIDTPVKRYSSGMYVRLAFAVAAHLDPEILIVDEVLAVGDAEFQKKCLGKMGDVAGQGRTVLFVSHNMGAISQLCSQALILDQGKLHQLSDDVDMIVNTYLASGYTESNQSLWTSGSSPIGHPFFQLERLSLISETGEEIIGSIRNDGKTFLQIKANVYQLVNNLLITYKVFNNLNQLIYMSSSIDTKVEQWPELTLGENILRVPIPPNFLNEGNYTIQVSAQIRPNSYAKTEVIRDGEASFSFFIEGGLSESPVWTTKREGILAPILNWEKV